jgi:hypothetical protein
MDWFDLVFEAFVSTSRDRRPVGHPVSVEQGDRRRPSM